MERHGPAMAERSFKPRWGLLYLIAITLVVLVGMTEAVVPAGPARTVLETFVVLVGFGLMLVWRRANRVALDLGRSGWR
jgi:hypothetical protein